MSRRTYEISIVGEMTGRLCGWFEDLDVTVQRGTTHLHLAHADESMLHGVLARIDVLGLELLDVHPLDAGANDDSPPTGSPGDR